MPGDVFPSAFIKCHACFIAFTKFVLSLTKVMLAPLSIIFQGKFVKSVSKVGLFTFVAAISSSVVRRAANSAAGSLIVGLLASCFVSTNAATLSLSFLLH